MTKDIWKTITEVGMLLCFFLVCAGSTSAQSADFSLHRIGDDVWAAIVTDAGKAGGNAGFVVGDEAIAVIDTFEDPADSTRTRRTQTSASTRTGRRAAIVRATIF
jgi:hypothetical protein